MYEFTCAVCGVTKRVHNKFEVRTFCSRSCAATAREMTKMEKCQNEIELEVKPRTDCLEDECVFQPESITCTHRNCSNCGWNPSVAKARLEKIGAELPKYEPERKVNFGEWISVETRLPRDRVQVLAYTHTGRIMSLHCKDGFWCAPLNVIVTHWMPMPNAPRE